MCVFIDHCGSSVGEGFKEMEYSSEGLELGSFYVISNDSLLFAVG